jgi:hypothetical protein
MMTLLFENTFWMAEGNWNFERSLDYSSGTPEIKPPDCP